MTYSLLHTTAALAPGLVGLDGLGLGCRRTLVRSLPASGGWDLGARDPFGLADDAELRRLLEEASRTDDALGRYLAAFRDARGLPPDASLASVFGRLEARTLFMPDVTALLPLPSRTALRDTLPIVLRGGMSARTPPVAVAGLIGDTSPAPIAIRDNAAIDLSGALAACLIEERVQARPPTNRRASHTRTIRNKRVIWAAAAALAAISVVTPLALRRALPSPALAVAVSAPAIVERAPPAQQAVATIPRREPAAAVIASVATTKPARPDIKPVTPPPIEVASAEAAPVAEVGTPKTEAEMAIEAPVATPAPAHPARLPVAIPLPIVAAPSAEIPPKTVVARTAKRKARKSTISKDTTVALSLPDVLKPQ